MLRRHTQATLGALLFASLALVAAACGGGSKDNTSSAGPRDTTSRPTQGSSSPGRHKLTVALVPENTIDPFYLSMKASAATEAKKLGMGFIWQGASSSSAETQIPVLAGLLARKPSALIVAPADPTAITGTLQRYRDAGIPVITVDTTISDTKLLGSRITSDNAQGGAAAADACGATMKGSGDAAVLYTEQGTTTTVERGRSFTAEMKRKYPNVTVLSEYDNDSPTTASAEVSSLLLGHPNLKCIFGTNDYGAEGAAQAVESNHDTGKVTIAGYDAEPQMVTLLRKNSIQIIIAQKPALEAEMAVEFAHDLLTGHKSRVQASVEIANVTMTRSNIDEPSISRWIYK